MVTESSQAGREATDSWVKFLARGERFEAKADMERIAERRAWNQKMLVGGSVLLAVFVAAAIVPLVAGARLSDLMGFGMLAIIIGIGLIPRLLLLRKHLDLSIDDSGCVISVSSTGIGLPGDSSIRWSELAGLGYLDRSRLDEKLSSLPIVGFGPRWIRRAGEGSHILKVCFVEGQAAKDRGSAKRASMVRLWGRRQNAVRPGVLAIFLDSLLDDETQLQFLAVVRVAAENAQVPFAATTSGLEHSRMMSQLLARVAPR